MKKILIIGNSGSGKSWLSKQLSRKLQLQEALLRNSVREQNCLQLIDSYATR
ncbi:AAA family ATPase [Vibrio vulnificus]|uniref:AAA family ATPase n=1 Tax=Vibrio vulnificus TaxID=672 RepID=UPI0030EB8357